MWQDYIGIWLSSVWLIIELIVQGFYDKMDKYIMIQYDDGIDSCCDPSCCILCKSNVNSTHISGCKALGNRHLFYQRITRFLPAIVDKFHGKDRRRKWDKGQWCICIFLNYRILYFLYVDGLHNCFMQLSRFCPPNNFY